MRSDSARLTLVFVLIIALIQTVFCSSLYLWVRNGLEREQDRKLSAQVRVFSERVVEESEEVRQGVHPSLAAVLEASMPGVEFEAEVRDSGGKVLFVSEGYARDRAGYRSQERSAEGPGGRAFAVRMLLSDESVRRSLGELLQYFAAFGPLVLALSWFVGLLFVRRTLTPVEEMRRQAERISRSNVSERIPVPASTGELRDLANTLNDMLDRLERAMQDLQNFAADAAHELRTPLATLRATMETAVQEASATEEHAALIGTVYEEIARMNRIVSDLFTLAKLDMRQYALQKERVRLAPLLEEARELWQPAAAERGIEIRREGPDVELPGDPVALRRVFMNLVENAVKYNRDGGRITLSTELLDGWVRIRVIDTGLGIAPEHLPHLFKRFYRIDKGRSRESGNAGLGLAICRSFVEAHEGKITVSSVPSQGTTFTIDLPASRNEAWEPSSSEHLQPICGAGDRRR